ncbi:hypothetical protein [Seleniivibrio woodruffii]|uniref:hypothetical protein n=1 Tax=Seleniivibrio woodruffii TaxID=1078050 RepID=UPI00240A9B6C|nr:hypothetical protein [Seleniivibrio woodruffii]
MKFRIFALLIVLLIGAGVYFFDDILRLSVQASPKTQMVQPVEEPAQITAQTEPLPEKEAEKVTIGSVLNPLAEQSPFYRYSSKVLHNDPALAELTASITAGCYGDVYCQVQNIFEHIRGKVPYVGEPDGVENILAPYETLAKGGDCEDLSILLASMLNTIGLRPYLVVVPEHMYVMACGLNGGQVFQPTLINVFNQTTQTGGNKAFMMELKKLDHVQIEADGSSPFDITVFPSRFEYERYREKKQANYYPDCSAKGVMNFSKECLFSRDNAVLMVSGSEPVVVSMRVDSVRMPNVRQYRYDNMSCIMLDPSYRGNAADIGSEMPKNLHARKEVVKAY